MKGLAVLIVGLGGGAGSAARYLLQLLVSQYFRAAFPAGTFTVNVAGSFAIGSLYGIAEHYALLSQEWKLFLITGFCGGFTTFSSFCYESIALLKQGNYFYFGAYLSASLLGGTLAALGGIALFS